MPVRVAQSKHATVAGAVAELRAQLGSEPIALAIYFASSKYAQTELASSLHTGLGATHTIGCSTSGEIITGSLAERSVVVMALAEGDAGPVAVELIHDLGDTRQLDDAIHGLGEQIGTSLTALDVDRHVGIVLMDGMGGGEERFLDALGDRSDLLFVGGSAGDDLTFAETWVSVDGVASNRGAVLAVLEPTRGFEIIKTQSFVEQGRRLVATKVDEANRVVIEFDGRPAADAYADAIGTTREQLSAQWIAHPLGLMDGGDPFVRSPRIVTEDNGVAFFCAMKQGMSLSVLSSTDIVADTRASLARSATAGASGLVNFNCILRTLDLKARGQDAAYGAVFGNLPTVGFSTYGEAYIGHVNQTATMLLLR